MSESDRRLALVKDLGRVLVKTGALRFGAFTLRDGKHTSYYVDLKSVPSFPSVFRKTIETYIWLLTERVGLKAFAAASGIPVGGLTFASVVAYELKKPLVYIRKGRIPGEAGRQVVGVVSPGMKVVILDDLVRTGSSIVRATDSIRREGGVVTDAVVLIDRLEGARQALSAHGVLLHALTEITELCDLLCEMQVIGEEQRASIYQQLKKA